MNKEIKVFLYAEENDSYVELWKVIGEDDAYIGRFVYGRPNWVYLCDPLGYCEMDYSIPESVNVIVCTPDGEELFASSNGSGHECFQTPRQDARRRFAEYKKGKPEIRACTGDEQLRFRDWLLSFKDNEQYRDANDFDENWIYFRLEETGRKDIQSWNYLGYPTKLQEVSYRHTVCGVTWKEIQADETPVGLIYDAERSGPMYSHRQASEIIGAAIRSHLPPATTSISVVVNVLNLFPAQRNIRIGEGVDLLLDGNYRRSYVDRAAAEERRSSRFYLSGYRGIDAIRERYPNCTADSHIII